MNSQQIKEILLSEIHEVSINYEKYCNDPKRDFSRKRKLPLELMLKNIIGMGSKSITNELIDIFLFPCTFVIIGYLHLIVYSPFIFAPDFAVLT